LGASDSRRSFGLDAIARIQLFFPNHKIYYYDLNHVAYLFYVKNLKKICNLQYRHFNFSQYPSHVGNLKYYAWKPLVIHELLLQHPGVFWIDSSTRMETANISAVLQQAVQNGGFVTFDNSGHSIFAATHNTTYKYLPITAEGASRADMRGANVILVYRTKQVYENLIKWWVLCALVRDCMAPTSDIVCSFHGRSVYAGCHRFDQSALNILAANYYLYNFTIYASVAEILTVDRGARWDHKVKLCTTELMPTKIFDHLPVSETELRELVTVP